MNKFLLGAALAAVFGAMSVPASAGTIGADFTVSATLSAKCINVTSGTPNMNFGAYTAFGGPATAAPTATLDFRCTKNLSIVSATLDSTTGAISGVNYSLAVGSDSQSDDAGSGGRNHSYTVTGTMAAGQAGDSSAATGPNTHTLTITY